MKFPIAPEGWPFILVFGLLAVATAALTRPWIALFPVALFLFMVFFFRDPERVVPEDPTLLVAPADGEVVGIRAMREDRFLHTDTIRVSIFMSPLNVHVNRAPTEGRVREVKHSPGRFMAAFKEEAALANEHISMVLSTRGGELLVRQVAGFLARRAVCRVKPGDRVGRGERYGVIKFGSRVDLFLPANAEVLLKNHDRVRAGETPVARVPARPPEGGV